VQTIWTYFLAEGEAQRGNMSQLDPKSFSEAIIPQLDLFSTPPTNTSVDRIHYQDYRPISQLTSGSPIDFLINNSGSEYTDLSRSRLYIKGRIVKGDRTLLTKPGEGAVPVNNFLDSIWSQVDVTLSDKLISVSTSTYPYKAYFKNLLSFGHDAKYGQLGSRLWSTDRGTAMDGFNPAVAGENEGLIARSAITNNSAIFDLEGSIREDFLCVKKYLLNVVDINLRLYPSRHEFYPMSTKPASNFKFEILEAIFRVCRITATSAVLFSHNQALQNRQQNNIHKKLCKNPDHVRGTHDLRGGQYV
jgi:hypothetical protein